MSEEAAPAAPAAEAMVPSWAAEIGIDSTAYERMGKPESETAALKSLYTNHSEATKKITEQGEKLSALEKKLAAGEKPKPSLNESAPISGLKDIAERAGLDYDKFTKKIGLDGELSAKDYEAFAQAGYDKPFIDSIVEGRRAVAKVTLAEAQQFTEQIYAEAGGEDEFRKLSAYAKKSWSEEQIKQFDQAVEPLLDNGDPNPNHNPQFALLALKGLKADFAAAIGDGGAGSPELGGTATVGSALPPFTSKEEQNKAFRDPRMGTDENYRKQVLERMAF